MPCMHRKEESRDHTNTLLSLVNSKSNVARWWSLSSDLQSTVELPTQPSWPIICGYGICYNVTQQLVAVRCPARVNQTLFVGSGNERRWGIHVPCKSSPIYLTYGKVWRRFLRGRDHRTKIWRLRKRSLTIFSAWPQRLVPRPLPTREKGPVHTDCACARLSVKFP